MNNRAVILILLFCALPLAALPSADDKIYVRRIMRQVELISGRCGGVDELGRNTLQQSANLLKKGPETVYCLSTYLNSSDWRIRFWIVDLMGYLNNPDAQRPLLRILQNKGENVRVRRQAYRSLRRLKIAIPEELKQGL